MRRGASIYIAAREKDLLIDILANDVSLSRDDKEEGKKDALISKVISKLEEIEVLNG